MSPARRGKIGGAWGPSWSWRSWSSRMFPGSCPWARAKERSKALCWVSPKNPNYIKEVPGKDPEGHELVPVYPTPTGEKPAGPAVAPGSPGRAPDQGLALPHASANRPG